MTELSDGISITGLTIGGAALTALGGMIGAIIRARMSRTEITPQPLEVRGAAEYAYRSQNDADHANVFARISEHDKDIAYLKATAISTSNQLERMDKKLDRLLERSVKI